MLLVFNDGCACLREWSSIAYPWVVILYFYYEYASDAGVASSVIIAAKTWKKISKAVCYQVDECCVDSYSKDYVTQYSLKAAWVSGLQTLFVDTFVC